ncbi:putative polysaccharide deacetylase, precursor (plasmid) [Deinococcus deserti VCD115]|uniref:Putative polysaccharide deacetylase n=2 Tax=Deinococcus TaxID=1298 RepID=C1D213_DEIDV|nr:putative polysaccharide deacetylase, precursor [Deinococcus deserti VCD115]
MTWIVALGIALSLPWSTAQARPVVMVFHQVGTGTGLSLSVSPETLRQRVMTLRSLGYRFVTSTEAASASRADRVAVIQFDDGFESVYQLAFPVLRELGVPGTAYVIWSRLNQPGSMTTAQLAELRAAGWEIGNHSHSHATLSDLAPRGLQRELMPPSSQAGERPARCVAYPLNRHDARVRREAKRQGMQCGVAGGPPALGRTDPMALPAPAITAWDDTLLPLRARWGIDARAPLLTAGFIYAAADGLGSDHPPVSPPLTWNPAHYELLGNGAFSAMWRGERELRLAWREGAWSLNLAARRGVGTSQGRYTGGAVALNLAPLTVAAGVDTNGPLLGAALALGGYGEVWGRTSHVNGSWGWAWGGTLIPADYWQVTGAHDHSSTHLGLRVAVPWQNSEGRPLRVGGGYRWGVDQGAYAEVEYHVGSYGMAAEVTATGRFGVRFTSVW